MANVKISDLPLIDNIPPTAGVFPIVYNNVTYKMDWSQLNNQITASGANPLNITGTGTTGTITKWTTGGEVIGDSVIVESGGNVGIGESNPEEALEIKTSSLPAIQLNQNDQYKSIIRLAGNDLEIRGSSGAMEFYNGSADGDSSALVMSISSVGVTTLTNSSTSNTLVLNGTSGYSYLRTQQSGVDKWAIGNITSVSDNLEFYNGTTQLTIGSGGDVAIGAGSTLSKRLNVYDSSTAKTAQQVISDGSSTSKLYLGTFSNNAYLSQGGTFSSGWASDGTNAISQIIMSATDGNSQISFATSTTNNVGPTDRLTITSGGNVGIGTTTPSFATIDSLAQRGLEIKGTKESGTAPVIRLSETGSGRGFQEIRSQREGSGNYLSFGESADTFMTIRSDDDGGGITTRGNVGIGTTSPGNKLHIEGSGLANESVLRVNNQANVSSRIWLRNSGQSGYIFNSGTTPDTLATGLFAQAFGMGINNDTPIQFYNGVTASVKFTITSAGSIEYGNGGFIDYDWDGGGASATHTLNLATVFAGISFTNKQITVVAEVQKVGGATVASAFMIMWNRRIDGVWASTVVSTVNNGGGTVSSATGSGTTLTVNATNAGALRGQVRVTVRG